MSLSAHGGKSWGWSAGEGSASRFPEQICVGSDSNSRISMLEELRMLELAHRLQGDVAAYGPTRMVPSTGD